MAKIACCHNCVFSYWDREHTLSCMSVGLMHWPACANHPDSHGRMQRTPPRGICRNYRAKPEKPEGDVRQIPLGDGFYAYVDDADYKWLSQWNWRWQCGYAGRWDQKRGKVVYMHREIIQPAPGMIVDHKNCNKLDNTRDNLRNATRAENLRNRSKRHGTSSRFIGVSYNKRRKKYLAQIHNMGKSFCLGLHVEEIDAARAYDSKAIELFGEFAHVNFPEEWPQERRTQVNAQRRMGNVPGERKGRKAKKTKRLVAKRTTHRPLQRVQRTQAGRRRHENSRQR